MKKLPLTVFEEFMFWEDRPAYPWSCFAHLHFSGQLQRKEFEAALQLVLQRHDLLRSRIEQKGKRLRWLLDENPQPQITWMQGPTGGEMPRAKHLDLRNEIGLRVFVVEAEDTSELTLQFHHSCCDGAGILDLINELLIAYALEMGEKSKRVKLPELDKTRLKHRGKYGLTFFKFLKLFRRQLEGLRGAKQFLQRDPVPLVPHEAYSDDAPPPEQYPAIQTYEFNREETKALRDVAKQQQVTLNDLLARDFFLGIADWREKKLAQSSDTSPKDQWLRMGVPMNLRAAADRKLSAANVVSMVFLDRRGEDFDDPNTLLQGIHDEMQLIKDNQLGLTFIFSLKTCKWLPGGLKKIARKDECTTSCVFTNVGKPLIRSPLPKDDKRLVAGNVILERMDVLAPIRPYNCATFASNQYADRLLFTLHHDPRLLSPNDAYELLATVVEKNKASMGQELATNC